jgi:hypothetical protein
MLPDDLGTPISPSRNPGEDLRRSPMPLSNGRVPHTVSGFSSFMYFAHCRQAEEERARRRGHADHVTDTIPRSSEVSDTTVVPDTTRGTAPPVRTAPPSLTSESAQQHPSSSTLVTGDKFQPVLDSVVEDPPRPASPSVVAEDSPQPSPPPVPLVIPQQSPNAALLPTPTSPTHNDSTPPTSDPGRCAVVSPSLGVFTFNTPSAFVTSSAIEYLGTIHGGEHWVDMVKSYLQLEQSPIPPGVRIFIIFVDLSNGVNLVPGSLLGYVPTRTSLHMVESASIHSKRLTAHR